MMEKQECFEVFIVTLNQAHHEIKSNQNFKQVNWNQFVIYCIDL